MQLYNSDKRNQIEEKEDNYKTLQDRASQQWIYLAFKRQFEQTTEEWLLNIRHQGSQQQSFIYQMHNQDSNIRYLFPINDSPSLQNINSFNNQLLNGDSAYFHKIWKNNQSTILSNLNFILTNWHFYQIDFSPPLQTFIHIIHAKIKGSDQKLYANLPRLIEKIQSKLQIASDRRKAPKCQSKSSDLLFQKYVEELESLSKRQGAFYIKGQNNQTKIPIGQFIANHAAQYYSSNTWKEMFFIAACSNRQQQFIHMKDNPQIIDQQKNRSHFLDKITDPFIQHKQNLVPSANRICCAKFFYYNFDIYDRIVNNCPILTGQKLKPLDAAKDNKQAFQVMLDIIALMNCGGGIILFNTVRNYLQIWPKGESIIVADQQKYRQIIENCIANITPRVRMDKEIVISFVPVAKNPYTVGGGICESGNEQILYIKGLYVMRITVRPINLQTFYYYSAGVNSMSSSCISRQSRKTLKGKQLIQFYKAKLQQSIMCEQCENDRELQSVLKRHVNYFYDHAKCQEPQPGLKAIERKIVPNNANQNIQKYEKDYKYLTLLVANKNNHSQIKQKLKNRGTECQIVVKYAQYKFRAANNSAALYHNERFDRLLTEIAYNKQFQFNGRFVMTILVTQYLKLADRKQTNPFPEDEFIMLQKWLYRDHPQEKLTLWRYNNGQEVQFYLKTESKITTIFMYYVLSQFNERCLLKNPPNYEKMSSKDKETHIKLYYPLINSIAK